MMRRPVLALTLIALCLPAAWGAGDNKNELEGTWRPSAAELAGKKFPDEVPARASNSWSKETNTR